MISRQPKPSRVRPYKSASRQKFYTELTIETGIKLIFNCVLALIAIASLGKLLPYNFAQQTKLKELRAEVEETEARVADLREQLTYNFDPEQTQNLIEQYSSQLAPNQSKIFWLNPKQSQEN
ncbi:hypothetical protein STA3757_11810 [Stanieria sp. NIES-3757]|nr:hypothetical protein STA3757_11810 [Stanieria sp. NIES-3757]